MKPEQQTNQHLCPLCVARKRPSYACLVEALRALLDTAEDMRGYVPNHFAEKWNEARDLLARVREHL